MSSGEFTRSKYECSADNRIYRIRVQEETLEATFGGTANSAPAEPAAGATANKGTGSVRVSGSNRLGIRARSVTIAWDTDPPDDYKEGGVVKIPVLTKAAWDAWTLDATGTYLETAATILGRQDEEVK
jgi:hypothetical protein